MGKTNHLFLIDGSGYIFRAYYALPQLYRKRDGLPTGAVNGFCNMIYKLIEDTNRDIKPSHIAVIFDSARKTFRNDIYKDYKANRGDPPEDLIPQFQIIKDSVKAFGIQSIELSGFEADDIIATYARISKEKKWKVSVVSSDKDLMQIVDNDISLIDTMKNKSIGPNEVLEKFGVEPVKVIAPIKTPINTSTLCIISCALDISECGSKAELIPINTAASPTKECSAATSWGIPVI